MKKILLITLEFPPQIGGIANYLYNIFSHLPEDRICVLANKISGDKEFDKRQNYKIYRKKLLYKIFRPKWLRAFLPALKIVRKEKIEVLHISHVLPMGYVAYLFKKTFRIPYVVYTHGLDILHPQSHPRKKIWLVKILQNAELVVANSSFTANEVNKLGVQKEKIKIINPCLDLSQYQKPTSEDIEKLKNAYGLKNKKILLTIGRLVERKGIDMVIKALPEVLLKIPDLIYVIVGDGADEERLGGLVEKNNLEDKVIFIGGIKPKDLGLYHSLADVFIMPSRQLANGDVEGFGIVYLEANLFGKPVIAGRSGGVPDAVKNGVNGLLVNPENVEEITGAIIKLFLNQELYNQLAEQGERGVREKFICQNFNNFLK
ncbi:MAG: glycosyltransferase family 4 protein [Patescibacteria group bacterium]|nr:glycosyltransferase family 4 protein [Patescibacteria group bacterium]MDD5490491.1 glycosyltransferase family 4 protein [Patescibacteria group bacterium]